MRIFLLLLISFLYSTNTQAEAVTLSCVTSDDTKAADLIIDLETKELKWVITYDIVHQNINYITAYQRHISSFVGGEIFVFNRHTGDYLRAGVSMTFNPLKGEKAQDSKLRASTYSGRCLKKII